MEPGVVAAPRFVKQGTTSVINGQCATVRAVTSGGTRYYYHHDQIGRTLAISDFSGSLVQSYAYDPYGNLTSSSGSIANPFQFQGQLLDATTGLYYLRARFYDPVAATFTRSDPVVRTTRRAYVFALDDSVNRGDPSGLWTAGLCQGGTLGVGPGAFAQDCFVVDSAGHFGTTHTVGCGGQTPTASLNAGVQWSTAKYNRDLQGPFAYAGAGGAAGIMGGDVTGSVGNSPDGPVVVGDAAFNGGPGSPIDIHGGISTTKYSDWTQPVESAWSTIVQGASGIWSSATSWW